jgi:hypothetical protein
MQCLLASTLQTDPQTAMNVVQVSFGRRQWQLPRCQRPHPEAAARAAAFAAALLAGHVIAAWQPLVPSLLDRPGSLAAAHARHVPRIAELLAALTAKRVGHARATSCVQVLRLPIHVVVPTDDGCRISMMVPMMLCISMMNPADDSDD